MKRAQLLEKAFQRSHLLTLKNPLYKNWIKKFILDEVKGDIGNKGDITSNAVIKSSKTVKAVVKTREPCILAGVEESIFLYKNNNIKVKQIKKDGNKIKTNQIILKLEGKQKDLLRIERSALDILQRMSGIATLTHKLTKKTKIRIAPTRKTQWRYLDKKATYIGGGLTHRLALWESILIKDNHLAAIKKDPIVTALKRAYKHKNQANFIEIETQNKAQAIKAAKTFRSFKKTSTPFLIMLDNMKPKEIKQTIKELKQLNLYNHILLEASGGITPKNIASYSKTGVDVVSLGYLTNAVKATNIKQTIE